MPRGRDAKVWNEDLVEACRARETQCRQQGKARQHLWRDAAIAVESCRADIYAFKNGRIVNFPKIKSKTAEELLRRVVLGLEPIHPPGYVAAAPAAAAAAAAAGAGRSHDGSARNPYLDDPYLKRIKVKSGAFAILMAMHVSRKDVMTKAEICRIGQPFCDEPMDANYLQGRPYAGWSSISTLTKHLLVLRSSNVVYRHQVGGLRNEGVHTFSLTNQGRQFIEALLESRPEVRDMIRLVTGSDAMATTTTTTRSAPATPPTASRPMSSSYAATAASSSFGSVHGLTLGGAASSSPPWRSASSFGAHGGASTRKVTPLMNNDEESLRRWAETALVGQQKVFACGKDRRGHLHDVCTRLNAALVRDGRRLHHESHGTDPRSRQLFVTVHAVAAEEAAGWPSARKRLDPVVYGGVHLLGMQDGSPAKRARPPAAVAAAQAALARQAMHESLQERKQVLCRMQLFAVDEDDSDNDNDGPGSEASRTLKTSAATAEPITIDSSDDDGDSDNGSVVVVETSKSSGVDDRKPPARARPAKDTCGAETTHQRKIVLLDDDDDDDDDLPPPSYFAKASKDASTSNAKMDQDVCILIDSRERDRNATPRAMRMAMTQMLSQGGTLSAVWPRSWKLPVVEEQTLSVGDFAFDLLDASGQRYRVPVHVERKRVIDLVQRSAKKDHWRQLQRMKTLGSVNGACIFLIEGDLRTAERFTAYGAQEMDMMIRNNFAIEDQDAAVRFLGRAILSCRCLRFLQTNAEVATYEAIAAVAMVASSLHSERKNVSPAIRNVDADRGRLMGFLHDAGIPRDMARCVADEFGSLDHLRSLYERAGDPDVCEGLLFPIIEDVVRDLDSSSSAHAWSSAIHKVVFSALKDVAAVSSLLDEWGNVVDDEARLLSLLHSGVDVNEAMDKILSEDNQPTDSDPRRIVNLGVTKQVNHLFTWAIEDDSVFYRLNRRETSTRYNAIPVVSIHTTSGAYASDKLFVFVLDGPEFVRRLTGGIDSSKGNYLVTAQSVAAGIVRDCDAKDQTEDDTKVVLIHGLQPALDQQAKKPGFCLQSRAIASMVMAQIMLVHNTVVLQAVRKTNDCEMMLQQLILSCYQFQLLTRKVANTIVFD